MVTPNLLYFAFISSLLHPMFQLEVRCKFNFLIFFFFFPQGRCFFTVKILGNIFIKNLLVSAVPGLILFCLCKGAGSYCPGFKPHICQCAPTFKSAAKSSWKFIGYFVWPISLAKGSVFGVSFWYLG